MQFARRLSAVVVTTAAAVLAAPMAFGAPVVPATATVPHAGEVDPATNTPLYVPEPATTVGDPSTPDPADAPADPNAVSVVTETSDGDLQVREVPAANPEAKADRLDDRPGVVAASPVRTRAILAAPITDGGGRDLQWALNHLGAESAWKASTGSGVTVAVVDTGVDSSNSDLAGRVVVGYDAIRKRSINQAQDPHGHGTHVAGSIVAHGAVSGIAPNARIMPVRVMDSQGYGSTTDIIRGTIWATNHGAQVINLSLGSNDYDKSEYAAIQWARKQGVIVVAAAGNNGTSQPLYPAAYDDWRSDASETTDPVIGVGAIDQNSRHASFSQRGNPVDVSAPGVKVLSTFPRAIGSYTWESGTSMASPYVAGVAALGLSYAKAQHPEWSVAQRSATVKAALLDSATDLGTAGTDSLYGRGEVTAAGTLQNLGAPIQPTMLGHVGLAGQRGGRAKLHLNVPAGSTFNVRLTSGKGARGAAGATTAAQGAGVWSGVGTGHNLTTTLTGLNSRRSYTVAVFATSGDGTSRTITGLRPVRWKVSYPRSIKMGARKRVTIGAKLPSYGVVPAGKITVAYRWTGHRKNRNSYPLSGELMSQPIPSAKGKLRFKASIAGGDGFWPSTSKSYKLRYRR